MAGPEQFEGPSVTVLHHWGMTLLSQNYWEEQ